MSDSTKELSYTRVSTRLQRESQQKSVADRGCQYSVFMGYLALFSNHLWLGWRKQGRRQILGEFT